MRWGGHHTLEVAYHYWSQRQIHSLLAQKMQCEHPLGQQPHGMHQGDAGQPLVEPWHNNVVHGGANVPDAGADHDMLDAVVPRLASESGSQVAGDLNPGILVTQWTTPHGPEGTVTQAYDLGV